MVSWDTVHLGDICDVLDSRRIPITERDRVHGEYPYYGASGILDYVKDYIFDERLILIGEDGAKWGPGENSAFIVEGKYWVNNHAHVIRPHTDLVVDKWIVYYLNFSDLRKYVTGLTVPKLNQAKMREIIIPLPPLAEQQRIVALLDQAFAGIAIAKANAEKNLQNARELFETYLSNIFENPVPVWEECNLEKYVQFIDYRGKTPKKTLSGLRLITAKNVKNGYVQTEPQEFVDPCIYDTWMTRGIPIKGDVLFTTEAPLANVAQLDTDEKVAFAQRIIILHPDTQRLHSTFLKYMLLSRPIRQRIFSNGTGATVMGIKASLLKKIDIYVPKTLTEQQTITDYLNNLDCQTRKLENVYRHKLVELDNLKKSVLQAAFAGGLTA